MNKRVTSILLAVLMLVSMLAIAVPVSAAGQPNVTWKVDPKASPGGTFTVTVSNETMTAAAIAFGISFDASKLEVVSVTKAENSQFKLVENFSTESAHELIPSTDEEIQTMEKIGFEGKASAENTLYEAGEIAKITFKVKEDVEVGAKLNLSLFESSAKVVGEDVEDNYHVSSNDTTEKKTVEIVESTGLLGDVNGDGDVNMDDVVMLMRHVLKAEVISDANSLESGEVTGDLSLDMDDVVKLMRYVLKAITSLK